jgi:hypothetical protein
VLCKYVWGAVGLCVGPHLTMSSYVRCASETFNLGVVGSSPTGLTIKLKELAQLHQVRFPSAYLARIRSVTDCIMDNAGIRPLRLSTILAKSDMADDKQKRGARETDTKRWPTNDHGRPDRKEK